MCDFLFLIMIGGMLIAFLGLGKCTDEGDKRWRK